MRKGESILVAFITGAAVGTALGILYAPDKGRDTRNKLAYRLSKNRDQLKKLLKELMERKSELLSEAKAEGKNLVHNVKEQAESLLNDVEDLLTKVKDKKGRKGSESEE